ncbi:sodium:proton exchanger [Candidatus Peregrinibacteria bacterium CG10_big_fil_rev_8_21_14_0_10_49_16]|nr:MAG: sodium:proton exchanger [Candidatus Peregrinibacteria bacterium CG22_combo_CG10-13_8_21_14_all_49_11]PIR52305.1 MAG: sodium:proton exchanger [Candidatus Peregrinibacteria bacterium CG10_big_fil_rev_8_21_14_0_10_49_16]
MLIAIGLIIAGFILVIKGAEWLVDGSANLARHLYISELTIGLSVVAFGTSLPELVVNIFSTLDGANDLAIGNIIGSNISNILLILGTAATITPLYVQTSTVWKELPLSLLAALVLFVMANDHLIDSAPVATLSKADGLSFLGFFLIFLWYTFGMKKVEEDGHTQESYNPFISVGHIIAGILILVVGGKLTVYGAEAFTVQLGVSEALIGLTVLAIGTSLPELATSVTAAVKQKADIAVGNIIGSNIFNIFWILGLSATIRPLTFEPALNVDLLVVVGATILLFLVVHTGKIHSRLLFWRQKEGHIIQRSEGIFMLSLYAIYLVYLGWRG